MALEILALIPARAGSRGLRHKNIQPVGGTPMLVRAIELALRSRRRNEAWTILVSTDSRRYAALAEAAGARVPFLRPARLASDRARLVDVALHALDKLTAVGKRFDAVVLLSAATPLTLPTDVRRAVRLFAQKRQSVVSVVDEPAPDHHRFELIGRRLRAPRGRRVGRRQDGPALVRLNGAILVASPASLARHRQFFVPGRTLALVMPRSRSVDVEEALDLEWANWLESRAKKENLT